MLPLRRYGPAVALLSLCLGWSQAPAAEPDPSAKRRSNPTSTNRSSERKAEGPAELAAAIHLYERLDFEAALEQLGVAKSAGLSADERVLALLYEGIILANLSDVQRSSDTFREALRLQPSATLPVAVSPKVEQVFRAAIDDIHQQLAVRSTPVPPSKEPGVSASATPSTTSEPPSVQTPGEATHSLAGEKSPPTRPQLDREAVSASSVQDKQAANSSEALTESRAPTKDASSPTTPFAPSSAAPWVPAPSPSPEPSPRATGYQVAIAIGANLAVAGLIVYGSASTGRVRTTRDPALRPVAAAVGLSGLALISIGLGLQAFHQEQVQPSPQSSLQPALSLSHQGASLGARLSFQ